MERGGLSASSDRQQTYGLIKAADSSSEQRGFFVSKKSAFAVLRCTQVDDFLKSHQTGGKARSSCARHASFSEMGEVDCHKQAIEKQKLPKH
jgi:hypothetical protein